MTESRDQNPRLHATNDGLPRGGDLVRVTPVAERALDDMTARLGRLFTAIPPAEIRAELVRVLTNWHLERNR